MLYLKGIKPSLEKGKTASWNHLFVAKLLIFASACQYTVTC